MSPRQMSVSRGKGKEATHRGQSGAESEQVEPPLALLQSLRQDARLAHTRARARAHTHLHPQLRSPLVQIRAAVAAAAGVAGVAGIQRKKHSSLSLLHSVSPCLLLCLTLFLSLPFLLFSLSLLSLFASSFLWNAPALVQAQIGRALL